jgi:uncharacterized membrane protein
MFELVLYFVLLLFFVVFVFCTFTPMFEVAQDKTTKEQSTTPLQTLG